MQGFRHLLAHRSGLPNRRLDLCRYRPRFASSRCYQWHWPGHSADRLHPRHSELRNPKNRKRDHAKHFDHESRDRCPAHCGYCRYWNERDGFRNNGQYVRREDSRPAKLHLNRAVFTITDWKSERCNHHQQFHGSRLESASHRNGPYTGQLRFYRLEAI